MWISGFEKKGIWEERWERQRERDGDTLRKTEKDTHRKRETERDSETERQSIFRTRKHIGYLQISVVSDLK